MATPDQIRHAFERYCAHLTAHDPEAIADLYADDAVIEDPAGSPPIIGRAAIREFYAAALARARPEAVVLTGPVRVLASGLAAAATLESRSSRDGRPVRLDIIDVMTFDATGHITSMHAYWGPDNIHPVHHEPSE